MNIHKGVWLTIVLSLMTVTFLPEGVTAELTDQQKKMINQLDQLDQLDHLEFMAQTDRANACIRARDYACAEKKIAKAAKYAINSKDKAALRLTKQNLAAERQLEQEERAAAAEEARQIRLAEERSAREEEERRRREQRAQEDSGPSLFKGALAIAAGTYVGNAARNYSPGQQTKLMESAMKGVLNSDMNEFNSTSNQVMAEKQQEHNVKMRQIREQRERDERAAQARKEREERAAQAQSERDKLAAANKRAQDAERVRLAQTNRQQPQLQQGYPQKVTIPTWPQSCPPGYSPARHPNGVTVTVAPGAYCIKDPQSTPGQASVQGQGNSGRVGTASGGTADKTTSGATPADAYSSEPAKKEKKIEWGPIQLEALAICRQSTKNNKWWCDGPGQELILFDNATVEEALGYVGCNPGTAAGGGTTKEGKQGYVYRCGYGLRSYDRDIKKIHGLITAPRSYICPKYHGAKCTTFYDGQDKR
ncbi:MAG: hypothetical protein HGB32_07940 [Geobacteraceae bacterium]|nr:hypothetical protein [Geobacteraceae bacterium]NTW80062.1 hypothetical protein [Geobacteraceae bacterium]